MNDPAKNQIGNHTWPTEIYQQVWDGVPDAIILVDESGQIIFVNEKVKNLFGYSPTELIGDQIEKLVPSRFYKHHNLRGDYMQNPHEREKSSVSGIFGLKKDGNEFTADIRLKPIKTDQQNLIAVFIRDLTNIITIEEDKKKLQELLFQSQKTHTLGQLTGGIAHDFRNILNAIKGFTELADIQNSDTDEILAGYLKQINTACIHGEDLVCDMMSYSRKGEAQKVGLILEPTVDGTIKMLSAILPSSIDIILTLASNLPKVLFSPTHLQQVIINLCTNARDAMSDSGQLNVSLEAIDLIDTCCDSCNKMYSGKFVELRVHDTGTGITRKTLDHIFEHLFTTKDADKGTGMGLAVVNNIVHDHEGHILVESEPGAGSSFRIFLPAVTEDAAFAS